MTAEIITATRTITTGDFGPVQVTYTERGDGRPYLILHGGAGPRSVGGFADLLAAAGPGRVIVPVHPGFDGTPRPESLSSVRGLASLYAGLLDELGLTDVTVIGNSVGGWIAAEIALLGSPRVSGVVLANAVGLQIDAYPIADFFSLTLDQVTELSYYQPDRFRVDLASVPDAQKAIMAANRGALQVYGGTAMGDPGLLSRLPGVSVPVLVVWGAADRIVPPEHGRAYAAALPDAELRLITTAGHMPQLETPDQLLELVRDFNRKHAHGTTA
jgi:pimeloyl-ACP methyl ester carboxylesterase